jgi:hypothetical protein
MGDIGYHYLLHEVTDPTPTPTPTPGIVIDNEDARLEGEWEFFSPPGCWGDNAIYVQRGSGGAKAVFEPGRIQEGIYEIFVYWPDGESAWATNLPVFIYAADHMRIVRVNLQETGGEWNSLGRYHLSGDGQAKIVIPDMGNGLVVVDAVKLIYREPPPSPGMEYYVSVEGNDAWDGCCPDHEGELHGPWRTIQKASDTMSAGDTVYVRGGTYEEQVNIVHSGTEYRYISYRAYPGERPVVRTNRVFPYGFNIVNDTGHSWIRLDGFGITDCSASGINASHDVHHLELLNCEIYDTGTSTNPWSGSFMAKYNGDDFYFFNCVARDNTGFGFASDFAGAPPGAGLVKHMTFVDCTSYHNGMDGFGCYSDGAYLFNCTAYSNGWNAVPNDTYNGDGFDFKYTHDTIMERCAAWNNNLYSFAFGYGYNIAVNCMSADTQASGFGRHPGIYFCRAGAGGMVANCSVRGVKFDSATDGRYVLRNNIIRKNGASSFESAAIACRGNDVTLESDYNMFLPDTRYSPCAFNPLVCVVSGGQEIYYPDLAAWRETGSDEHSIMTCDNPYIHEVAPIFDFHLKPGAVPIDAGTSDGAPLVDFDGRIRDDEPAIPNTGGGFFPYIDIGAFEYASDHNCQPYGYLDTASPGLIGGWGYDPDAGENPIQVHVYFDGYAGGGGTFAASVLANGYRPDVPQNMPYVNGDCHGFSWDPSGFIAGHPGMFPPGSSHAVYVYLINEPLDPDSNPALNVLYLEIPARTAK